MFSKVPEAFFPWIALVGYFFDLAWNVQEKFPTKVWSWQHKSNQLVMCRKNFPALIQVATSLLLQLGGYLGRLCLHPPAHTQGVFKGCLYNGSFQLMHSSSQDTQ